MDMGVSFILGGKIFLSGDLEYSMGVPDSLAPRDFSYLADLIGKSRRKILDVEKEQKCGFCSKILANSNS